MCFKIVCVFFVLTKSLSYSTCIDLEKYEVNNDHVPELPEYYDWEPIPKSAFENGPESSFESVNNTSSEEGPEKNHQEDENVVLEDEKETVEDENEEEEEEVDDLPEDIYFAGPVKAKGTVTVGANYGYGSSYPTFPYPWFPPYFYYPFYPPYPDYYPYLFPDPNIYYDEEFVRNFNRIGLNDEREENVQKKRNGKKSRSKFNENGRRNDKEDSSYDVPISSNGNEAMGKVFGGFVPASGNVKIFAQF